MKYLVDSEKMRRVDELAQEQFGIPAILLMERAALAVAREVEQVAGKLGGHKVKILAVCGTGNNGGDGAAAARILYEWGYAADIMVLGDEKRASDLMKQQLVIARNSGLQVGNNFRMNQYDILIDAVFGIGLSHPVEGRYMDWLSEMNLSHCKVVSVDIPSGVQADNGRVGTVAVHADVTVTFGYQKIGLMLYPGRGYAGRVVLAEIGLPKKAGERVKFPAFTYEQSDLGRIPPRVDYSNKGTFGRVLVIAGSRNMAGACYLSAKAAYRAGVGLVKILTVEDNREALQTMLPEAILSTYHPDSVKNKVEIEKTIQDLGWATAIVVGPGMGLSPAARQLLEIVLKYAKAPVVVDADALHLIAHDPQYVTQRAEGEKFNRLYLEGGLILTPHLKEMSDLLSCEVSDIQEDLIGTALSAIKGRHFVLALKDARTVVAGEEGLYINNSGNSGMATAGAGDVLTGIIAAMLGRGMSCFEATAMGVYLHGLAGDAAAAEKGKDACMAGDIIEGLAKIRFPDIATKNFTGIK